MFCVLFVSIVLFCVLFVSIVFCVLFVSIVLFCVLFVSIVLFCVLFVSIVLFCALFVSIVLFCVLFVSIVLFCALFVSVVLFCALFVSIVCICVLYYCHRVATQLQLTNISYRIIFLFSQAPDAIRGPIILVFKWYKGLYFRAQIGRSVKPLTSTILVMYRAVIPPPHIASRLA